MTRALVIALALVACKKETKEQNVTPPPGVKAPAQAAPADGIRRVNIEATNEGYQPSKITGKPNEQLKLVFKRTIDSECLAELKTPDGKITKLPLNEPVEVSITVPASGELKFACGMEMFFGTVVADPGA